MRYAGRDEQKELSSLERAKMEEVL